MSRQDDPGTAQQATSGKRTALLILGIALLASVTTVILALHTSHRTIAADAAAEAADEADLRASLSEWQAQVSAYAQAPEASRAPILLALPSRGEALSNWKARTPCGQDGADHLRAAMDARVRLLEHRQAGQAGGQEPDEAGILATTLRECKAAKGRDVNI